VGATAGGVVRRGHPQKEIGWSAVYHHFRKWSRDGSFERLWQGSIMTIREQIDTTHLNLDGTQTLVKRGGEAVAYQPRKRAKTCTILPISDAHGCIVASTGIVAGNHHDAQALSAHLKQAIHTLRRLGFSLRDTWLNADAAFDTCTARRICFQFGLRPNIAQNRRNRKQAKRGRKRLFNPAIYRLRFACERTFAWIDSFRSVLIRFDRKAAHFLGRHFVIYTLINLRSLFME
jgi:transposase